MARSRPMNENVPRESFEDPDVPEESRDFDPKVIYDELVKRVKTPLSVEMAISMLIGTILDRGTNIDVIRAKSPDEVNYMLDLFFQGILSNRSGRFVEKKDITLTRIAACYPSLMARSAHFRTKNLVSGFDGIPHLIRTPYLAAVLPRGEEWMKIARVNFYWLSKFEAIVRPRNPISLSKLASIYSATHGCPVMGNDERVSLMKDLKITPDSCDSWAQDHSADLETMPTITLTNIPDKSMDINPLAKIHLPSKSAARGYMIEL